MIIGADYTFAKDVRWNLGWPTPNYAAAFVASLLPWCWGALTLAGMKSAEWRRRIFIMMLGIFECALWFSLDKTYSRGGLVAVLAAGIFFALQARKSVPRNRVNVSFGIRAIFLMAIVAMTGFYVRLGPGYAQDDGSVVNRLALWRGGLKMIAESPVTGWGTSESGRAFMNWFQTIGDEDRYTTMVNSYLHLAVERGLFLLVVVLSGLWIVGWSPGNRSHASEGASSPAGPIVCAARASVVAWAVANIFTTLWIDPWLWIVPGVSTVVSLVSLRSMSGRALGWHVVAGLGFGMFVAGGLYGGGVVLSRKDSIFVTPGERGVVTAVNRGARGPYDGSQILTNSATNKDELEVGRTWEVWTDHAVLGRTPGQELREWLAGMPMGSRIVVHSFSDAVVPSGATHGIVFFGRQVERMGEIVASGLKVNEIWVVHPYSHVAGSIPVANGVARVTVILPEVDQFGQNGFWRAWAEKGNARVVVSPAVGNDVQAAWPEFEIGGATAVSPGLTKVAGSKAADTEVALSPVMGQLASAWNDIQADFHGIALNGTWRESTPLGASRTSRLLNLRCRLDHHVEIDAHGKARTVWAVAALRTWLVPDGRDKLVWQPPGGSPVEFELADIKSDFGEDKSAPWKIRRAGSSTYELRGPGGASWFYSHGLLTHINHPLLGYLAVRTQGGLICEIRSMDPLNRDPVLLSADYDDEGNPTRLNLEGVTPVSFVWSAGQLVTWTRADGSRTRFSYTNGLVSGIDELGKPTVHLAWEENPGFERGDSRWFEPVHLCSDDSFDYSYEVTTGGYLIHITNRDTGERETMLYNPLRRQLRQTDPDGSTLLVTFRPNAVGQIPEKIEEVGKTIWPF